MRTDLLSAFAGKDHCVAILLDTIEESRTELNTKTLPFLKKKSQNYCAKDGQQGRHHEEHVCIEYVRTMAGAGHLIILFSDIDAAIHRECGFSTDPLRVRVKIVPRYDIY